MTKLRICTKITNKTYLIIGTKRIKTKHVTVFGKEMKNMKRKGMKSEDQYQRLDRGVGLIHGPFKFNISPSTPF